MSAGLIYALIPGLNFLSSLAVAACLTPTDPILAAAVVGGKYADKHVPAHLRHLLAAESGCNDGAAFPFLFIALYLTIDPSTGRAISDWFLLLWLCACPATITSMCIATHPSLFICLCNLTNPRPSYTRHRVRCCPWLCFSAPHEIL